MPKLTYRTIRNGLTLDIENLRLSGRIFIIPDVVRSNSPLCPSLGGLVDII